LQPEPKYQTQSYITYIYMSIRKVSVSVTIQPTAKAQRTQRRKAEVEKMRSWEAERRKGRKDGKQRLRRWEAGKLGSWEAEKSQPLNFPSSKLLSLCALCAFAVNYYPYWYVRTQMFADGRRKIQQRQRKGKGKGVGGKGSILFQLKKLSGLMASLKSGR